MTARTRIFTILLCGCVLAVFIGCEPQEGGISPKDYDSMPTTTQAHEAMKSIHKIEQVSREVQQAQTTTTGWLIAGLIVVGIALPVASWLMLRQFLASQEARMTAAFDQRQADLRDQLLQTEQRLREISENERAELQKELDELRSQADETRFQSQAMFTEALTSFRNTREPRKPGRLGRMFGIFRRKSKSNKAVTVIEIPHRQQG